MSNTILKTSVAKRPFNRGFAFGLGALVIIAAAVLLDTKYVKIGSSDDVQQKVFSKDEFGAAQFPTVQKFILDHAVDARTLGAAIAADKTEAGKKYGMETTTGPVIPVTVSGVVGEAKSGIYQLAVDGLPDGTGVRVQLGPAINGTDLRDADGEITFGQFTNQIEYQDAGSALNNEMKKKVLSSVDPASLAGKKITVTGVFKLINPKNWLVTPVKLAVE
jgi:predicted lipoprotein